MSFLLGVVLGVSSTVLVFLLGCPPDPVPAGQPAAAEVDDLVTDGQ